MDESILTELGLTQREITIYTILLRLGEIPVADLVERLGVHPQLVYRAVDDLAARELVRVFRKNYKKYVQPESPRTLLRQEQQRLERLKSTLPSLLALQGNIPESITRVSKGNQAVKETRLKITEDIEPGGTLRIINASGKQFYRALGKDYLSVDRKRVERGIRRLVVTYTAEEPFVRREPSPELTEYRYLDGPPQVLVSTPIGRTFIAQFIWADEPVVVEIESPEVVQSYVDHFEVLWKLAKPAELIADAKRMHQFARDAE